MKNTENKPTLAETARMKNQSRLANSLIPGTPQMTSSPGGAEPVAVDAGSVKIPDSPTALLSTPVSRTERKRASSVAVEDVVGNSPVDKGGFNKMIGITEEHHELLRVLAFQYRKPMTTILHNTLELLNQTYLKENQK